ncbi:MAG TPA: DoxX family protein [Blastocatellia bacterium]|nr:DoxX family protein [Blastocatellia bacterium]
MVALIFIVSGFGKIAGFGATKEMMANVGFPMPGLFLAGAIVLELAGGFALLFGFKAGWAAIALIVFLIPATVIFHAAYLGDPVSGQQQTIEVLKNLAILGALVKYAVEGAGAFSPRLASSHPETGAFSAAERL